MTMHDTYGQYTPSVPNIGISRCGPIPPLPCANCTETNVCDDHKYIIYVKIFASEDDDYYYLNNTTFTIPYGRWENWCWYCDRIREHLQSEFNFEAPLDIRVIFAGSNVTDKPKRHSGLQFQSTLFLGFVTPPVSKTKASPMTSSKTIQDNPDVTQKPMDSDENESELHSPTTTTTDPKDKS